MEIKNDEEKDEQQTVDDSVDEHRGWAGSPVHELQWLFFSGHLKQRSRRQKSKQRRRYQRTSPIVHFSSASLLDMIMK